MLGTMSTLDDKDKKIQILLEEFNKLFKEPRGFPPKWAIQHEIYLIYDATLSNIGLYR